MYTKTHPNTNPHVQDRHRVGLDAGLRDGRGQGLRQPACPNDDASLGWFLRAAAYYAGSGMVYCVLPHETSVLQGAIQTTRRTCTWVMGVFCFSATLGMFFTGQVLRWEPDAYWGLAVGGSMAGRVPVSGRGSFACSWAFR